MVFDNGSQIPYIVRSTTHYKGRQLKKLLNEFKAFLMQGNVLDLAVAVVIGAAFKAIIDALVADVINPIIGLVVGESSFDSATATLGSCATNAKGVATCKGVVAYGHFLGQIFNFVIIGAVIFVVVKSFATMQNRRNGPEEETPEPPAEEVVLLREIRDALARRS